jgi:hypothetical protein
MNYGKNEFNTANPTSDDVGLPGTDKFVIPDMEKDSDFKRLLMQFTTLAVGREPGADPVNERKGKKKAISQAMEMATRALALLASTQRTNDAIRRALGFLNESESLTAPQLSTGFTQVVTDLVETLFAHNGHVFQEQIQDSSRKPSASAVTNSVSLRHKELVRTRGDSKQFAIDLDAETEYVTPQSLAAEEEARIAPVGKREHSRAAKRRAVDYSNGGAGGSQRTATVEPAHTALSDKRDEDLVNRDTRSKMRAASQDGEVSEMEALGGFVPCPTCDVEFHSDEIVTHADACAEAKAEATTAATAEQAVQGHKVPAPQRLRLRP